LLVDGNFDPDLDAFARYTGVLKEKAEQESSVNRTSR